MSEVFDSQLSIVGDDFLIHEEPVSRFGGYTIHPTEYHGLHFVEPHREEGIAIKLIEIASPQTPVKEIKVWQNGGLFNRKPFAERLAKARSKAARAAGALSTYRSVRIP
jgi:hypothetical protein